MSRLFLHVLVKKGGGRKAQMLLWNYLRVTFSLILIFNRRIFLVIISWIIWKTLILTTFDAQIHFCSTYTLEKWLHWITSWSCTEHLSQLIELLG
jgi:hypothetical protein